MILLTFGTLSNVMALEENSVVAEVNGRSIFYKDIHASKEGINVYYQVTENKDISTLSNEQLAITKEAYEKKTLARLIDQKVFSAVIVEYNISIDQGEIKSYWENNYKNIDTPDLDEKSLQYYRDLIFSIEAVAGKDIDFDVAYQNYLSGHMSKNEWLVHYNYFKQDDRIEILKSELTNTSPYSYDKMEVAINDALTNKRIDKIIQNELLKSNKEFSNAKKRLSNKTGSPEDVLLLSQAEDQWWAQKRKQQAIKYHYPELKPEEFISRSNFSIRKKDKWKSTEEEKAEETSQERPGASHEKNLDSPNSIEKFINTKLFIVLIMIATLLILLALGIKYARKK